MGNYEKPHEIFCSKCDGAITEGRSKKQVVTNWNTRPIEDELRTRIAELEEKQRWRVVANGELPEFGTSILFYDSILERTNKGTCTALNRDKTNLQWLTDDGIYYHGNRCEYITHWLPLPEPPEVQE
jgi:hypothetical protein